ncbi:MAG: hypothetical protein ACI4UJ_08285 [Candidatus Cryptobacteroides sp.]
MIDRDIFEKALAESIESGIYSEFRICHGEDEFNEHRHRVLAYIVSVLWATMLEKCGAYRSDTFLQAEAGVAELMRRGLPMKDIHFHSSGIVFKLKHWTYIAEKHTSKCTVSAAGGRRSSQMRWVSFNPVAFADFATEFDALVPEIVTRLDKSLMEVRKKARDLEIIERTVGILADEFLKPEAIDWAVSWLSEEQVRIQFSKSGKIPFSRTIRMCELIDELKKIPTAMKNQPEPGNFVERFIP